MTFRLGYLVFSIAWFVVGSVIAAIAEINPPVQHGQGMGAAFVAGYIVLFWFASLVNLPIAFIVMWWAGRRQNPPGDAG